MSTPRMLASTSDADQRQRMANYERLRKEALRAIEAVRGKSNPDALPLAEVVALMPDHPEWNEYRAKKRRRARRRRR
jgi:hypothetical protein